MPVFGHLYLYLKDPINILFEKRAKFGDVFRMDSGYLPTVWLCGYDDVSVALKKDELQHRPHHHVSGMKGLR